MISFFIYRNLYIFVNLHFMYSFFECCWKHKQHMIMICWGLRLWLVPDICILSEHEQVRELSNEWLCNFPRFHSSRYQIGLDRFSLFWHLNSELGQINAEKRWFSTIHKFNFPPIRRWRIRRKILEEEIPWQVRLIVNFGLL